MSAEHPEPQNDIEAHFTAIVDGHGDTVPILGENPPLPGEGDPAMKPHETELYSVLRSDGTLESGWTAYAAGGNVVDLKKLALDEQGNPVTLTKRVDVDAFAETQRIAERIHIGEKPVTVEMGKRVLMIGEIMDKKRRDTYPHNHRDDLDA